MAQSRRLWAPAVVALLVAGLLGVPGSGAKVAAGEPRLITASIMIPAAAFSPLSSSSVYQNSGYYLTDSDAGGGVFNASLSFPVPVVKIKRITLYGYDNTTLAPSDLCARVRQTNPATGDQTVMGEICTTVNSTATQVIWTTAINPRRVTTALHGPYLQVYISGPGVKLYAVKVTYTY